MLVHSREFASRVMISLLQTGWVELKLGVCLRQPVLRCTGVVAPVDLSFYLIKIKFCLFHTFLGPS